MFQKTWKDNPDPTALPFERNNPPFALTAVDWHQLSITDAEFTPHTWENLRDLISIGELDELKRWSGKNVHFGNEKVILETGAAGVDWLAPETPEQAD